MRQEPLLIRVIVTLTPKGISHQVWEYPGRKTAKLYIVRYQGQKAEDDGMEKRLPHDVILKARSWNGYDSVNEVARACFCFPDQESEAVEMLSEKVAAASLHLKQKADAMFSRIAHLVEVPSNPFL